MQSRYEKRLLRVIDHIHANPAGDLSLDALAEVAAMSRFHWHRVFHGMTGETVAEAVRRIRMHRASFWLVTTGLPIAEIAAKLGYPSVRSFARAFAEVRGMTPASFRKRGEESSPFTLLRKGHAMAYEIEVRDEPPAACSRSRIGDRTWKSRGRSKSSARSSLRGTCGRRQAP